MILDCRVEEFCQDMTPEERNQCRCADARIIDIDVPDVLWPRAVTRKRRDAKKCSSKHKFLQEGYAKRLQDKWSKLRKQYGEAYKDQ